MTTERLTELFTRHLDRNLTSDERVELMGLFLEPSLQPDLQRLVKAAWEQSGEEEGMPEEKRKALFQKIFEPKIVAAPVIEMASRRKTYWKGWVAAASLLFIVMLGTYLVWQGKDDGKLTVQTSPKDIEAPKSSKAMITLANGQRVYLDSASSGQLAIQGNVKLVKLANGQIAYETVNGEVGTEIKYNTLENPRGSKVIDMMLADGSHVWLNAGSSVTYPVAFVGNERKVSITGEAYFEVAHDVSKPFFVNKGEVSVQVLGTHFNVNAYDDEENIKVTLLEGKVKVGNGKSFGTIKPGQQAVVTSTINIVNDVDLEEVMAWKNGLFQFEGVGIDGVMRQIARWYDVEVVYDNKPGGQHFRGEISRDVDVSKVFRMLEATGTVHFRIEGKKVFVGK